MAPQVTPALALLEACIPRLQLMGFASSKVGVQSPSVAQA